MIRKEGDNRNVVKAVNKIRTGSYNEQARKVSHLLKTGGGAKRGADLVEF